ncbi:MAG: membrane protein insertase YidC [Bacilli bacterium]|nr:membrane protein insertase YidC [Bacilli bacterium]
MKKRTKLGLLGGALLLGTVTLASCTSSFCSTKDKAHMMFAFDFGVTAFYSENNEEGTRENLSVYYTYTKGDEVVGATIIYPNIYVDYSIDNCPAVKKIVDAAANSNYSTPSLNYWKVMDKLVLTKVFTEAKAEGYNLDNIVANKASDDDEHVDIKDGLLHEFGYLKFYYSTDVKSTNTAVKWENWDELNAQACLDVTLQINELPSIDFVTYYKKQMTTFVNSYRSCIAIKDGSYGYYGIDKATRSPINIESKSYGYAWKRGFFEGLLVWPIAALTDTIALNFSNSMSVGIASLLAILIVTVIIRTFMVLVTFNQTTMNAKMTELQPEIQKIQNKYPNSNTSRTEKMRVAEETQKLYKKHNIHPFRSMLVMIIQFPVFICVWGALSGSAALSTGSFLNLNLSSSISSVLFNASEWNIANGGGALTALFLFIFMALAQAVAMLLPQWMQKAKQKKVTKLGKNPARQQQNRNMQIFTWVMLAMIIFMGFSLASGMGVYWLIGALFSVAQTLITQMIMAKKAKKKER